MDFANITQFFWVFVIVMSVSIFALIATVGTWTVQFFAHNRQVRHAKGETFAHYYKDLILAA